MSRQEEIQSHPEEVPGQMDLFEGMISPIGDFELAVRLDGHLLMLQLMTREPGVYSANDLLQEAAAGRLVAAQLLRRLR